MKCFHWFFGVFISFFLLFLSVAKNDSFAACPPDTVKIAGHAYTSTSIQDAYNYASTTLNLPSFTLQLQGQIFTEDLLLNGGAVVLDGGYDDCSFTTKTSPSRVFGTITIRNGSLNYAAVTEGPKVVSTDQCAFDNDVDGYSSIGSCTGSADDCNDNVFAINPGASEICDGLDNNCDGQIDEGLLGTDADGDGYYAIGSCGAVADDCNDNNAGINPGAVEIPYDGIDQDCSGADLTYVNGNACADCHVPDDALDSVHNYRPIATSSTCVLCHAGPVSSILSGHYGKTVRTTDNNVAAGSTINCWTCHDNNNHSGGPVAGAFGDGLGDVWNDVSPPYPANYTCDDCHASRAARHATATAHNNRVIDSTCANCHTSDTTVLGSPGTGSLASAADVDALHGVAQETDCALCHNYSGTLLDASVVRQTIQNGLSGTQVSCLDCHIDKGTNHGNFEHPIEVGPLDLSYNPGQLCSDCHVVANWTEIEGTEHNVDTNGAGSCATCHNSGRQIVQNVIADAPNYGGYPIRCLACHADKELVAHGSVDHVAATYVTRGTSFCLDCHDPGTAANATVDITHNGDCTLCHTTIPALQPGVPAGGGDCLDCHIDYPTPGTNDWYSLHVTNPPDHSALVTTTGTDNCVSCHENQLVGSTSTTHLENCTNCHNASDGSLKSLAIGQTFTPGNNCQTCHTNGWETTHFDNNNTTTTHNTLVRVDATSCSDCHSDPPLLTDNADAKVHSACGNCHNTNGSRKTLYDTNLQSFVVGGDCTTCHTTGFDTIHATSHTHTVAQGAGDLSFDPPGSPCGDCHVVATWTEIEDTEHNVATNGVGSCATCHNSDRAEVITAISTGANPTNCLDCHSNKNLTVHGSIDHVASGDVTLAIACADCHDDSAQGANWTVDFTHTANCTLCHTTVPSMQPGVPAGPADCATCHSAAWNVTHLSNTPDHSSLVTTTGTNCGNCHVNALVDTSTHLSNCSNCHKGDGSLVTTLSTDTKTFAVGGNCLTCHTDRDWTDHDIAHATNSYVTSYDGCTSCHAAALTDGAGFVDPANNGKHDACTTCHAADGAISVTVNDCSECHSDVTGDFSTHITQDHTTKVTLQTECNSCHTETVDYANFIDAADVKKHDACSTCHDGTTNAPVALAGDCSQCHTANYFDSHTHSHDVSYDPLTDTSQTTEQGCAVCHDDNGGALASWTDISVEHLGNCATCHSYTDDGNGTPLQLTVESTIASGTSVTCATCHTPKVPNTDHGVDHIGSSYVTGEAACLVCHTDPATTFTDPSNDKIHDNCATCHDPGTNALIGAATSATPGGPNTCTTCHTGRDWTDHDIAHATNSYVTSYDGCTSCHAAALTDGAGFVDPANNGKHDACTTCHAADGAISVTVNDCSECHSDVTGDFSTHITQDHTTKVTLQTECNSCHTETVDYANFIDAADVKKHDACSTCHDGTTNAPVALAGDCSQCHTANYFDSHTHSHDVSYDPLTDTSQTTEQGCAVCHDDNGGALASWTDISVEHLGNCATCHSYTDDGNGTPLQLTVESTIASGTSVTCATCHTPKVPNTDHGVDHIGSSYVTGEAACLVCHTDPATTFTDPSNDKIHDNCATCHDPGTNALIGAATSATPGGPNTCTTCHTGRDWTDHDIAHATNSYVTSYDGCTSCHAAALTDGAGFVDPANNGKHDACTTCHAADGAISVTVNDCSECHSDVTGDFSTHITQDHTTKVTLQTECNSCHTETVDYANFIDAADVKKHDACSTCHDGTTNAPVALAGDCSQCHTANYFDSHTHSHDVSYDPLTDTSQTTEQGCAVCHDDNGGALASWTDISVEHLGNCATCHSYTDDGNGTPLQLTVESTIASGTSVTCATCHTPKVPNTDHGVDHIGSSYVTGEAACLVCHTDPATTFTDPSNDKIHDNCATCHDPGTNALIGAATSATPGGPNTCTTCHTGRDWTDHNIDHQTDGYVTLHSECTSCHATTMTDGAGFVDPANNGKHDACTTCHAADGAISVTVNDCSECHSGETTDWTTHAEDHIGKVTSATGCASCHSATVDYTAFVDPADNVKHDDCYVCHDNTTKLASAAAGDCSQCHGGVIGDFATHTTQDHTLLVTQATGCSSCHSATVDYAVFVDPANNFKHDSCATCHDATTNAPVATAGDCSQCHAGVVGDFTTHTTQDHTTKVTLQAECSSCHTPTVDYANFIDAADVKKHDACVTCHNATTNAAVATAGDCSQCHTANYFDSHTHTHDVSYNPVTDTSQTTEQGCATCHNDSAGNLATFADIVTEHGTCSRCHDYTDDGNGTPPQPTVETTIATGTGVTCATCHTPKVPDVDHGVDHIGSGYVTGEAACLVCHTDPATTFTDSNDAKVHNGCTTCHDAGTNALIGSAVNHGSLDAGFGNPNTCTTCHTGRDWTDHDIDHATAGYVTLHSECTSCHAATLTAGADFINPADDEKHNACTSCHGTNGAISVTVNDCSECHSSETGDWTTHAEDHTLLVTQATGCASCHSATVDYVAFVDPANDVKHDNCYVCHDAGTKLASAAAGDCSQCHGGVTGDFATHTTQDHTTKVTSATGCASCHSATVDYAAFVDPANNFKHDSCATCHDATTNAPVATAGDCSQCHAGVVGDFTTHTTQDHTTKVTLQTECNNCHAETVDYANFIDIANDKKHDSCATCHNATTNAPVATAGDCSQCHTANYFDSHTHSHTVSVGGNQSNGQLCSECHVVSTWAEIEGTEHNVATNGAGSCATCHNSPTQTVIDVIAAGAATTCLDCHTDKTAAHGSIDHVAATYVTVGGTQDYYGTTCASCHDPGGAANATVDITHGGNCNLCHTTVPNLQPGVPAGGGNCADCHSTSEHTLWGRYLDTCSSTGCHVTFDGGPGNTLHDVHNPSGGWSDRNSATSGLTYPYSSDSNMWIPNWPLNPNCATCHTTFNDDQSGAGCGACHAFPGKGPLHGFHAGKKAGQMDIDCAICHFQS